MCTNIGTFRSSFREAIVRIMVVVYNATFNNISVISWSFDFIGEGNREKPPTCQVIEQTLSHNVVSSTPRHERDSKSQL